MWMLPLYLHVNQKSNDDDDEEFCESFKKNNEQMEVVESLPRSYLPYGFLSNLQPFLLWEKVKIFDWLE